MPEDPELSSIFERLNAGDVTAREELLPRLYGTLRRIAGRHMAGERPSHTLQPTALVNEAFLRVFKDDQRTWENRSHFLKLASSAMRTVLVDHARGKNALKRTPPGAQVELDGLLAEYDVRSSGLLSLDAALERLGQKDPELITLVELRFFGGRSVKEAAEIIGVSERKAFRLWQTARAWLKREIERE